jgi:hypothetical protein
MELCYAKTEAGRDEIRTRAHGLSRTVRNLLLMIDGHRSSAYLLEHIQGVGPADLEQLAGLGLIEAVASAVAPVAAAIATPAAVELDLTLDSLTAPLALPVLPAAAAAAPVAAAVAAPAVEPAADYDDDELAAAIEALSYQQLYKLLTDQARDRLGMIRGYKLALDVERTQSLEGLQQLAFQFVGSVRELRGPVVASEVRRELERMH